jgi:phage repressor protein C with HTH and peptisase S24 domain
LLSHDRIWAAIDALAEDYQLSPSGLARQSGLDSTSFNKSKRVINSGRLRWPSTESISNALQSTDTSLAEFLNYVEGH